MFKRPLSRNTRAKGIKLKHVLQILVLLGICVWLIFQVKHSRDKKKELNDDDERLSGKMQDGPKLLKLGRKDLDAMEEKLDTGEKQDKEDEEETGEHDKEEENQDQEERKHEETETDENDREKSDNEPNKEKDGGKGETESDEKQVEEENLSEDRDVSTRGAREEHYKAEDASSGVAHDAHLIESQTEEVISDLNNLEHEEKSSDRTTDNGNSTQNGSPQNSILNADLNGHNPEANDPDQVRTEAGNDSTQNPVSANVSVDGTTGNDPVSDNTHSDQNLTISSKDETGNGTVVVLSNSSDETESIRSSEIGSGPSESEGNVGTEPGEEGGNLKNGSENPARDDPVDSSDSHIAHEMHETRLDLDALQEIRTEIDSSDETAAE